MEGSAKRMCEKVGTEKTLINSFFLSSDFILETRWVSRYLETELGGNK